MLYKMLRTNNFLFALQRFIFLLAFASNLIEIDATVLEFLIEPSDVTVENGQSCVFDCVVKTAPEYPLNTVIIQWLDKDRQPLTYLGESYRSQLANGSLYISSVSEELSGTYQCLASLPNVGAVVSKVSHLTIATLSGFVQEPRDLTVYPGQKAYFACKVHTSLPPRTKWLKDERPLQLDKLRMAVLPSGALEIDDVNTADQGSYRCNVSGVNSYRLSNKANLILDEDLEKAATVSAPVFVALPQSRVAIEGETVTFDCTANGNPSPTIIWLKDGLTVDMANLDSRFGLVASTTSLQIRKVMEEDAGVYQCRAENREDSIDASVTLLVQVPPKFLKKPQDKQDAVNKDTEFECSVYGKPEPKIDWFKNGEIIVPTEYYQIINNGNHLKILGLMTSDSGLFQCIASNPAGNIQAIASLKVTTVDKNSKKQNKKRKKYHRNSMIFDKVQSRNVFSRLKPENHDDDSMITKSGRGNDTDADAHALGEVQFASLAPPTRHMILDSLDSDVIDINDNNKKDYDVDLNDDGNDFIETDAVPDFSESFAGPIDDSDAAASAATPGTPLNLRATIVKARFVTLSWQPPSNYNGEIVAYSVYYKRATSERERVLNTTRSRLEDINVGGLQPGQTYVFRVVAYGKSGPGVPSQPLRVVTQAEEKVPSAPEQFDAFATSARSIRAVWKPPHIQNGVVNIYKLYYMEASSSFEYNVETTNLQFDVIGLSIFTEYSVWVVALNDNGAGAASEEKIVRTFSAAPTEPPTNVTLEAVSSTTIIVHWEPPPFEGRNGLITGFKLRYRKAGRKGDTITTPGNLRSFSLTNLEKSTKYQVKLWALNINGTSPPTDWQECETLETDSDESTVPDVPHQLRVQPFSDKIVVMWNAPLNQNVKVRSYTLGWGRGVPDIYLKDLDEKQRNYVIEKLESNSEYVISLRANNAMGAGPSVYANVRTRDEPLQKANVPLIPPVGLKAQVLSSTSVVLYWTDTTLSKSQYVRDNRYYVVSYMAEKSSKTKYVNVTDLNVMIDDLKPNTMYEFAVKVVKERRESPWSMVVQNATWENAPNTPPKNVTALSVPDRPQSVELHWQPPKVQKGFVTGYVILYTTDANKRDREWSAHAVKEDKNSDVIGDLEPNTDYYFKVQARNNMGYGPFSQVVSFKTGQGRTISTALNFTGGKYTTYLIIGGVALVLTLTVTLVAIYLRRRRSTSSSPGRLQARKKSCQQIKPPDLWIHHDQMELKEKNDGNSSCGAVTLPRSCSPNNVVVTPNMPHNSDHHSIGGGGSSDKTNTYVQGYMATAVVPPMTAPTSSDSTPSSRSNYNYARAQYSVTTRVLPPPVDATDAMIVAPPPVGRLHFNVIPQQQQLTEHATTYVQQPPPPGSSYVPGMNVSADAQQVRRAVVGVGVGGVVGGGVALGHPLRSFSVPAPPPLSAPGTPQPKHVGSSANVSAQQITIRPNNSSPYKKASALAAPGIRIGAPPPHTAEEVQPLQPSRSTEELNQEMANLEGLMLTLNAITSNEFEC